MEFKNLEKQIIKASVREVSKADDPTGYLIGVASTGSVDRDGDILEPSGWQLDKFNANPVILYGHNRSDLLPIGKAEWVRLESGELVFKAVFSSIPFAQDVRKLYQEGILKSFSVSFIPVEYDAMLALDGSIRGYRFKKQELTEISAVPLPANSEAIVIEAKGLSDDKPEPIDSSIALAKLKSLRELRARVKQRLLEDRLK